MTVQICDTLFHYFNLQFITDQYFCNNQLKLTTRKIILKKAYKVHVHFLKITSTDIKLLCSIAAKVSSCLFSISVLISVQTSQTQFVDQDQFVKCILSGSILDNTGHFFYSSLQQTFWQLPTQLLNLLNMPYNSSYRETSWKQRPCHWIFSQRMLYQVSSTLTIQKKKKENKTFFSLVNLPDS